jgi:hypothetical protein
MSEASSSPRSVSSSAPTSASGPRTGSHHGHQTFDNISVLDMLQSRPPLHYKANASMSL